ncbi:hypothetical protein CHUAL_005057 [Chamberlinius hualienensis]
MAGLSKLGYVTLPYNCYEVGHTWSTHCPTAIHMFGFNCFTSGLKVYTIFYLADFLIRKKKLNKSNIKNFLINILQSSVFFGVTGYAFMFGVCYFRHSLGHFTKFTAAYLPGLISSFLGILVERRSRRCALTLYVANVASETLYRMLVYRNVIKPVPYGEVILFACSMAMYMYQLGQYNSQDVISKFLKYLFISNPTNGVPQNSISSSARSARAVGPKQSNGMLKFEQLKKLLESYFSSVAKPLQELPRSSDCHHNYSCVYTAINGFFRAFGIGYISRLTIAILPSIFKIIQNPSLLKRHLINIRNVKLGLFFGCFVAIYNSVNCCLRWLTKRDDPLFSLPAGFLAGLSMFFYRSSTVAWYVGWRVLEIFYRSGMKSGYLPQWDEGVILLYSASTALLFHAAVVEPHNLKPAYFRFLDRVTGGLVNQITRVLIDEIGIRSSDKFPNYLPNLDKRYMTENAITFLKERFPTF